VLGVYGPIFATSQTEYDAAITNLYVGLDKVISITRSLSRAVLCSDWAAPSLHCASRHCHFSATFSL